MSAKALRQRNRQKITLPDSKLEIVVRKIPPRLLPQLMKYRNPEAEELVTKKGFDALPDEKKVELTSRLFDMLTIIVPACVVSPKVEVNPTSDDVVDFDDLSLNDLITIFRYAMSGTGLPPEEQKELENFQRAPSVEQSTQWQ